MIGLTLNDRYQVLAKLGEGGMGVVYLASDLLLERQVAVKLLNPEYSGPVALERLRREALMQARMEHPNIVRVYDVGCDRLNYFVMEYVEGSDLAAILSKTKVHERLHIMAQVANGLAFAHSRGLVHRDLKPQNVLVSVHGDAKVADFGLGRSVEEESRLTRVGSTVGSAHYMAPEQGIGKPVNHRADLYSLGVMIYQCATGRLPFVGRTQELISQHLRVKPTPPRKTDPSIPEELENLILRLLEKNPDKRPQSGESVRAELEQLHRAYWPIISVDEMRAAIGASARLAATTMKSNNSQLVVASRWKSPSPVGGQSGKITVRCTNCGGILRIKAADSTKLLGCPICDKTFRVPQPQVQKSRAKANKPHASPNVEHNLLVEALAEEAAMTPATAVLPPRSNHIRRKSRKITISVGQLSTAVVCLTALALGVIALCTAWPSDPRPAAPAQSTIASNNPVPPPLSPEPKQPQASAPSAILPARQPAHISLNVASNVRGAAILIDDQEQGRTTGQPMQFDLEEGRHRIEARFGAFRRLQEVMVGATQQQPLRVDFSLQEIVAEAKQAACLIRTPLEESYGSGFLVYDAQTVVTAAHVLDDARNLADLEFVFNPTSPPDPPSPQEERRRGASLIHYQRGRDLAILRLNEPVSPTRTPLSLIQEVPLPPLEVVAIGNPMLGGKRFSPLDVTSKGTVTNIQPHIPVDLAVREGNSGGPVLKCDTGEVIGVVSRKIEEP